MHLDHVKKLALIFLETLFADLKDKRIVFPDHWEIDHLCYRSSSLESYEALKKEFSQFGELLIESPVNGRMISTFKLYTPIVFQDWTIDLIELPAPKPGKVTPEGFEHIEVVCDLSFEKLKERFGEFLLDEKGLTKDFNQELELTLGDRNVKFHHLSLESVVTLEKKEKVWNGIKASGVLKEFRQYEPLIVGAFPLNLESARSTIEVLMYASDFSTLGKELKSKFGHLHNFSLDVSEGLLCQFMYHDLPFKIHVEEGRTLLQKNYKRFQAQERLLKYGGENLRRRVLENESKTESLDEAFALALAEDATVIDKCHLVSRTQLRSFFSL